MKLLLIVLALLVGTTAFCANYEIEAFFNHSERHSYKDPYRNIRRSGQNLEKVVTDFIGSAKKSVYIAVQEIRLPLIAQQIIKKHQEGLDVRVIIENDYNNHYYTYSDHATSIINGDVYDRTRHIELKALIDINKDGKVTKAEMKKRDAIYMLQQAGVKMKDDTADGSFGSGLMHHKFVIVDGKKVIVSSANFTMSGIHGDMLVEESRGNANSLIRASSPQLSSYFEEEFMQMWGGKSGSRVPRFGVGKMYRGFMRTSISKTPVYAQFSPTQREYGFERSVNGTIAKVLRSASSSVHMALFVFSDQNLSNALLANSKENKSLKVEALVEPKFATRSYSEVLDLWGLEMFNESCKIEYKNRPWKRAVKLAGVPALPKGDMLHHKFAVVDQKIVIIGSQNWSEAANHENDENILIIEDEHIASQYIEEFERLNRRSNLGPSKHLLDKIDRLNDQCAKY
ncbi:MAG: phospholipase D-like domain-containing protein [Bacteriovoracaceae bacterium]|nr:phospholipase D-like domain-containing protein [Bacteriovoracaceae bacterium]